MNPHAIISGCVSWVPGLAALARDDNSED
jgi:hypothetical protein